MSACLGDLAREVIMFIVNGLSDEQCCGVVLCCSSCSSYSSCSSGALTSKGMNGLMAFANNLELPIEDWCVGGVPITMMCHMERRKVSGGGGLEMTKWG